MTKGSDFDMHLINDTKYKVNSMRLTNNMCLTAEQPESTVISLLYSLSFTNTCTVVDVAWLATYTYIDSLLELDDHYCCAEFQLVVY